MCTARCMYTAIALQDIHVAIQNCYSAKCSIKYFHPLVARRNYFYDETSANYGISSVHVDVVCASVCTSSLPPPHPHPHTHTPTHTPSQLEEKQQSLSSIEAQMRESERGHGDVMKEKDTTIKSLQDQVPTDLVTTTKTLYVLVFEVYMCTCMHVDSVYVAYCDYTHTCISTVYEHHDVQLCSVRRRLSTTKCTAGITSRPYIV